MRALSVRKVGKRHWVVVAENRFLFWKYKTTFGGTFDKFGVYISWRNLTDNKPTNAILTAWLSKQVHDHLEQLLLQRQQKRGNNA